MNESVSNPFPSGKRVTPGEIAQASGRPLSLVQARIKGWNIKTEQRGGNTVVVGHIANSFVRRLGGAE